MNTKINEMYLIFNEKNELVKNYITTFGQAQCNLYGCISLKREIELLKELVQHKKDIDKEMDILLEKWKQSNIISYAEKFKELETIEQNVYKSYYNIVNAILTIDEIQKIQKSINYDFMSELFIDKMIELLESKEV